MSSYKIIIIRSTTVRCLLIVSRGLLGYARLFCIQSRCSDKFEPKSKETDKLKTPKKQYRSKLESQTTELKQIIR